MIRKMTESEKATDRKALLRALMKSENAFWRTMEEYGFPLAADSTGKVFILDNNKPAHESFPVGSVTIKWKLDK